MKRALQLSSTNAMSKVEQLSLSSPIIFAPYFTNSHDAWNKELEMNFPQQVFVNVSGIDPNDGAKIVFVWCLNKGPEDYLLLGSGHIVNGPAHARPPGIQAGQFSVTFLLPPGCSADEVFVTDDKAASERLTNVTVRAGLGHAKSPREEEFSAADDSVASHRISSAFRSSTTLNGRN